VHVAQLGTGFVAIWNSNTDGSGYGIYGQRFDQLGIPQGGEFRINQTVYSQQYSGDVIELAGGNFVVLWQSESIDGSGFAAMARLYDASGPRLQTAASW